MTKTEKAISQMEAWAADDSHGYDQIYRWGEKGDYDCSAAVISAWEKAGVPVKTKGATYTGNMYGVFTACGFKDVTNSIKLSTGAGLKRGDVLLNHGSHTAMYCGNGWEVEASINERGRTTGGTPGDQTSKEFLKRRYRNYPWNVVLRYSEASGSTQSVTIQQTTNTSGSNNKLIDTVAEVQMWLNNEFRSGLTIDGLYGSLTKGALVKALQTALKCVPDGIYGSKTNAAVKTLKKGDDGTLVKILQAFLVCNGYKSAYVDGEYGNGTYNAVKAYQESKGLEVDGKAGKQTFSALCK